MRKSWIDRVSSWFKISLLVGAVGITGCSGETTVEPSETEPVATESDALSSTERCDTEPADLVWSGGGKVRTSASYTAHDSGGRCFGAFLIDLNNYNRKFTKGTRVTYGRVVPTNATDCAKAQVRAYVWKKNGSSPATFLGNKTARGTWVTDSLSGSRCVVPSIQLEEAIPGFVPGASYRLGLSARFEETTGTQFREIYAATEQPTFVRTPFRQQQDMAIFVQDLQSLPNGSVDPRIAAYFGNRGTTAGRMECRVMELELAQMRLSAISLQQVGATSATTTARVNAFNNVYQGYCVASTAPALLDMQTRVRTYLEAVLTITQQIIGALGLNGDGQAAEIMAAINGFDMSRIMAGCGTDPVEVNNYIRLGTLPVGMTGPNVLLRSCTSDVNATQTRLGMTGSNTTIRNGMRSCIVNAFDTPPLDEKPSACGDPRAEGGGQTQCLADCHAANPSDNPCASNPISTACFEKLKAESGFSDMTDTQSERDRISEWLTVSAYQEAKEKVSMTNAEIKELIIKDARNGVLAAQRDLQAFDTSMADNLTVDPATGKPVLKGGAASNIQRANKELAVQMAQDKLTRVLLEQNVLPAAEQQLKDTKKKLCENDPNHPDCQPPNEADPEKMCPQFDLDGGPIWFNHMDGDRMNVADRIATCTCENLRRASFVTAAGIPQQWLCQTADEKKRFDCQTNPWGPNDGPPNPILRPECANAFQPASMERDVLQGELCDKIRCAETQTGVMVNGRCTCMDNPTPAGIASACNFNGPAGALDCQDGNLVCDLNGARCTNPNSGRTPFGVNPLCRITATTTQLGGSPVWGRTAADDLFSGRVTVSSTRRDAFLMKPGFRFIAGPENYKVSYDKIGTSLVAEVLQPSTLPADRGDLQAYCSNPDAGVNNLFLGQQPLAAGANTLSFALDSRCWGNGTTAARFGFSVRTATSQTTRAAFLGYRMGGTLSTVPNPVLPCGPVDPDPRPDFIDFGLLDDLRNGLISRGTIDGVWMRDSLIGGSAIRATTVPLLQLLQ
jgi:hypothetical protein